jgi:HK97 family phage major capsid protein
VWGGGIVGGNAATIMERPYRMSEYVPSTYTTGLYVAIVGDFSFYYIADSLNLEIQRLGELFSLRNQVGLLARKETDGMPVLEEAFSRLKLA